MKFDTVLAGSVVRKRVAVAIAAMTTFAVVGGGTAFADRPRTRWPISTTCRASPNSSPTPSHAAQVDYEQKLQRLGEADKTNADDMAALNAANAQLAIRRATSTRWRPRSTWAGPATR